MSPGSAGDPIAAATALNDAVSATAVVGALVTDMATIKGDVTELKGDMKHVRSRIDDWTGRALVLGAIVSLTASVVVSIFGQNIAHAIVAALIR